MKEVDSINKHNVDQDTVDILERLLGSAKSGELCSLLFVDFYVDGKCGHGWAGPPNMKMIGELDCVKHSFLSQVVESDQLEEW